MNILSINEVKSDLITFFRNSSIVPIVGSGISCGVSSHKGTVPNGTEYKSHMINELISSGNFNSEEIQTFKSEKFSNIADYYEDNDFIDNDSRIEYLKNNFFKSKYTRTDIRKSFLEIDWPYIYTLNIDDVIESNSKFQKTILPNRELNEKIFIDSKCVIKLHGDISDLITYSDSKCKIFTSKEYANSLQKNISLLDKLRNDYRCINILFVGCSLEDEIDLLTLDSLLFADSDIQKFTKRLFLTIGKPTKLQQSKLNNYSITDIIVFETAQDLYSSIYEIWQESLQILNTDIVKYQNYKINYLKPDSSANRDYFYSGKGLLDISNGTINIPYYFIERSNLNKILNSFVSNKIHFIYGNRISGKTYLIVNIYHQIKDRAVYLFDGRTRLNNVAFEYIMNARNSIILCDVGTFTRTQFETMLLNSKKIHRNNTNLVVVMNNNNNELSGLIKMKLQLNQISATDFIEHSITNKFDNIEIKSINKLLPFIDFPAFSKDKTIIDNLIQSEKIMGYKGRFSKIDIKINNYKELALLIVLAIKEKIYSLDIVKYNFEQEIQLALNKYSPFIDQYETNLFEKDSSDLSSIKYIVNAKFWLYRALGEYANLKENYPVVGDAYKYIVKQLLNIAGNDNYKKRNLCRDYILFDVINDIFLKEYHGQLGLIVYIYDQLHSLLAEDYHFLHQNAKCYLKYSYSIKDDNSKWQYLDKALKMSRVSASMIDKTIHETNSEKLPISFAHVQYTVATILCELCRINSYNNQKQIETAIDMTLIALKSPYNSDDYKRELNVHQPIGIIRMINYMNDSTKTKSSMSDLYRDKLRDILNLTLRLNS